MESAETQQKYLKKHMEIETEVETNKCVILKYFIFK